MMKKSLKKLSKIPIAWLIFCFATLFCEGAFLLATQGLGAPITIVYRILFALAYGSVGFVLGSLFKKPVVNTIISTVLLFGLSLIYVVEYFVFRAFKVFYDIQTIVGGAGGVAEGFMGEVMNLVLSPTGILMILLFFLPVIAYLVFALRWKISRAPGWPVRWTALASSAVCYGLCVGLIFANSTVRPSYHAEHDFSTAVTNFGLLSGLRLDAQNMLFGNSGEFEQPTETATDVPPEEVVKYNQMDLDFSKPASSSIQKLNDYVSSLTPSKQNEYTGLFKGKNLIMISAEAFTAEVIDPELTPTLHRLATKGINFKDHYQAATAGTTGGEYQNVFGMLPTEGGMSFKDTADNNNYFTMGSQLNRLGYYGKAFHNNSYTYYDRNKTHVNLGYSDGFMGYGNGMEQYVKSCWPQSDLEMISGTLPTYIDKQPFNVYYMSVSGHSGYSKGGNAMTRKNWDKVKHLPYSDTVKGYFAANLELENAMADLVAQLEAKGIADNTVICISADHFPYGLDNDAPLGKMPYLSELYGYEVKTLFQRDHSAAILWCGALEKQAPIVIDSPTSSLDLLPTLSNLFGTEYDSRLMVGRDVLSDAEALVFNLNYTWKTDLGTYQNGKFTPKDSEATIPDGYVERIKTIVRNKVRFCEGVLNHDYYNYLFG